MQDFVKNKEFTYYNQFIFIRNSEDFVKEIEAEEIAKELEKVMKEKEKNFKRSCRK